MKIKSIKKVTPRRVYAVKTSTGTFIADGLAHHNCSGCNIFHHGNPAAYWEKMLKLYGLEKTEQLAAKRKVIKKYILQDYLDIIEKYKKLVSLYEK